MRHSSPDSVRFVHLNAGRDDCEIIKTQAKIITGNTIRMIDLLNIGDFDSFDAGGGQKVTSFSNIVTKDD